MAEGSTADTSLTDGCRWEISSDRSMDHEDELLQTEMDMAGAGAGSEWSSPRRHVSSEVENHLYRSDVELLDLQEGKEDRVYLLTEQAKRENSAKKRTERKMLSEQNKIENEKILYSVQAIRKRMEKSTRIQLINIKNVQRKTGCENDLVYCANELEPSMSLDNKVATLESRLKKLEEELLLETMAYKGLKDDQILTSDDVPDQYYSSILPEATIENQKAIKNRTPETLKHDATIDLIHRPKYGSPKLICLKNKPHYPKLDSGLECIPKCLVFEIVDNVPTGCATRAQLKISNTSKTTFVCRYSHLYDPKEILRHRRNAIAVDTIIRRLRPGVTVDYEVRFEPAQLPNSIKYPSSLDGVKLAFETVKNNQSDVKYVFYVPLKFCTARPEPEVVSGKTITFPINPGLRLFDKDAKRLILKNNGPVDCKFSVLGESDYQRLYFNHPEGGKRLNTPPNAEETDQKFVRNIVHNVLYDLFSYFTWKNHLNVLLPAKKTAEVTVAFNHYNAESSMSKTFVIVFHDKDYGLPNQIINVFGQVKSQSIFVEPDVVDMGVCYLEGYCRIGTFALYNKGRVMIPFEIIAPRELNDYVELVPSKGYLKAGHRLDVHLRLNLKYDFLKMNDRDKFLKAKSGFLDFPLRVFSTQSWMKLVCEVRVFAVVSTSFGLKLSPKCLRFGAVNTTETVVRNVRLANHSLVTMDYGFLKLPERVCVLPSAFGTIFSGEQLHLQVYYSPRAKDMPKDVHDFKDEFDLTCTTIAGMNANEICDSKNIDKVADKKPTTGATMIRPAPTTSSKNVRSVQDLDHGPMSIAIPKAVDRTTVELNTADNDLILSKAVMKCQARVQDLPVELSAQKIVMAKTHFTSFSTCKFELRASNLASAVARGSSYTLPKFLVRFEFVSVDPRLEFKPKNGTLRSKDAVQIVVVFRPKLCDELQSIYDKHFNSEQSKNDVQNALTDKYSVMNQVVFKSKTNLLKNVRRFETDKTFFAWMPDRTITVPAVCFVQLCERKSVKHFGFERGSLKLSVVCPMTKPDFVVLSDRIDFGKCTMKVRHNDWLLVHNLRDHPIPLRISMPDPTGPFFCAYALNGEHTIEPDQTVPINVYFIPEHELAVKENIEIASGTMRVTIKLSGSGIGPSCSIVPDHLLFVIRPKNGQSRNKLVVQVTNTGPPARFNVQLEWTKVRADMADDDVDCLAESLSSAVRPPASLDGPEWTPTNDDVFDLGNGGRPLRRHLGPAEALTVTVTLCPPEYDGGEDAGTETARDESGGSSSSVGEHEAASVSTAAANVVYAAKLNVHVGQAVLKDFYVFGFVDAPR